MSRSMDMLNGKMGGKMIAFSLPLAASTILQQLFNSVDIAVVGQFAKEGAQAAVGANVANVGIFVNLLVGMSVGPNIVVATLLGQKDEKKANRAVHTSMVLAVIVGLILLGIGEALASSFLTFTSTPESIFDQALLYFRIYLIGIPFITIYNFAAAAFRSIGDTKKPLICLIVSGISNAGMNMFFVIVLHWDVLGVALATVISNVISATMIVIMLMHSRSAVRLEVRKLCFEKTIVKQILKLGLPSGIQEMVFSVSNMFIQTAINGFGETAIAGSSIALNFEYFTYAIAAAFGHAAITFSSQNYGAGNIKRCNRAIWISIAEGFVFTQILCVIFGLFNRFFAGLYSPNPEVVDFAVKRMMTVMILEGFTAVYDCGCGALRSVGKSILPSVITILGTVVFRIAWLNTVFVKWPTFDALMIVYPISWILTGGTALIFWFFIYRNRKKAMCNQDI